MARGSALVLGLTVTLALIMAIPASALTETEYPIPTPSSNSVDIASSQRNALFFLERDANQIGRITKSGVFTGAFPVPTPGQRPLRDHRHRFGVLVHGGERQQAGEHLADRGHQGVRHPHARRGSAER